MPSFINTLPYISNPIEEFKDFKFVSWDKGIYPKFKGTFKRQEIESLFSIIASKNLKNVIDLGVGGGIEISGILEVAKEKKYTLESTEANEISDEFIMQAHRHFYERGHSVPIHRANWLDIPNAKPPYTHSFDFGFLTGNSLALLGGGTREYTQKAQQSVISKFAQLIQPGGYLFIDSRNFDYIRSLMNLPKEEIFESFTFDYTVYYHGFQEKIIVFPAYISDTVVVMHYYDKEKKLWSKLDYYPIYEEEMMDILREHFFVEKVYHDFKEGSKLKSLFVQYLAKRI